MENLPGNSNESKIGPSEKPEDKQILRVVKADAKVVRRKKSLSARFMETFFDGADIPSIINYVVQEILVPSAKDMLLDAVNQGLGRTLHGDTQHIRRTSSRPTIGGGNGTVRYHSYSSSIASRRDEPKRMSQRGRGSHKFEEIVLETRVEADEVLEQMYNLYEKYESVSVAELYEMVGIESQYTDQKWGWTSLRGSRVDHAGRGEYILNLPRPEPLD